MRRILATAAAFALAVTSLGVLGSQSASADEVLQANPVINEVQTHGIDVNGDQSGLVEAVEIFNPAGGANPLNLAGWTLQRCDAGGNPQTL